MATVVESIDFDAVFAEITDRLKADKERRLIPPLVRLWDGDFNLRGFVKKEYNGKFQFIDNDTGIGTLELPLNHYLSKWLVDVDARQTTNVHLTVDKDGARWSGSIDELLVIKDEQGKRFVRVLFKHDYEHAKHTLVYSNPFARRPILNRGGAAGEGPVIVASRGAISKVVGAFRKGALVPEDHAIGESNSVEFVHLDASG
ncbi:hypothetical protein [Nocardia vulneris]|uniref:Gp28/Gp37-like domain-containing protein n=1 Tax=Nocardia vulneris TaxID=1141657 RepID=A0ABR4Z2R4_9NOCA|nr:hypothetical protein [Nocardia vulneris]KIA59628.1 hypothetical protein FG87_41810 [Nocardia vulneris]